MAGGLFGRPFVLNVKCIVFALILMAVFLYKPNFSSNFFLYGTLFIIFVLAYVSMAWYDYYYDCRIDPLKRGQISLTGLFKPEAHIPEKQEQYVEQPIDTSRKHTLIYMSHIIIIVPILAYIVVYQNKVDPFIYPLLGALAVFTLLYHSGALITQSHVIQKVEIE